VSFPFLKVTAAVDNKYPLYPLVQAFIWCHLDYCNLLLHSISDELLYRLQLVQNAAARLVTGTHHCDYITPMLRQLHWLSVCQRVVLKIAGLVHQLLVGAAPTYLTEDCCLLLDVGRHPLWSSSNDMWHEHIINLVIGVSGSPVLDCGTIFHLDCGSRDCPSTPLDNL